MRLSNRRSDISTCSKALHRKNKFRINTKSPPYEHEHQLLLLQMWRGLTKTTVVASATWTLLSAASAEYCNVWDVRLWGRKQSSGGAIPHL